ncbi:hypothetical protein B5E64_16375 [Drancourtella sp. An12]|uniref:hypothetical protein n=1 Tax=Drancourtella sp. An12 TaxID=1965548 RepID=UPI000B36B565|nr:hypothetical protein [Drancourtella sp. An12]OUQ42264.1 hypothetical protein B5E64_16375 [Drancourtella sp. An12]HIV94658.1 hypothetical protein [Candidatus Sellimonas avistercoris]
MNRFTTQPRRMTGAKYLISIGIFCVILFWFLGGLSSISKTTSEQELESLKQAVIRSSVQCYALEGFYPESLEYLEDHYGLTYDDDKYVVSYEVTASNLMPSIDVFALNETEVDFNEE